jgi:type IV pilus assembly protein PilP
VKKNRLEIILIPFVSVLLLTGCQAEKDDLHAYVEKVKSQQASDIPPIPVMKPYEPFSYQAQELRDPFVPTITELEEPKEELLPDNGIRPDQNRRKEVLENFALSELQFVGSLEQDGVWALIRSPDGVIHRVTTGNYMGLNDGEVMSVSDNVITLKEIVPEGKGRYIERNTSISAVEVE